MANRAASKGKTTGYDGNYKYLHKVKAFNSIGRVAYFGGCMSQLTPAVGASMEKIFQAAGQKFWYMDKERTICCGRPLAQQGFNKQAAELRRKNTELIHNSGATALITSCPICYNAFKNEYQLHIPVYHHTEYIDQLIRCGKLQVNKCDLKVTYHDPCELGRGCHIYDEPRHVLQTVATLLETENNRENSLCCGINLGNTVITLDQQTTIRNTALKNLTSPDPDMVVTACPMCKRAFQHGGTNVEIKDIAEIVANRIKS